MIALAISDEGLDKRPGRLVLSRITDNYAAIGRKQARSSAGRRLQRQPLQQSRDIGDAVGNRLKVGPLGGGGRGGVGHIVSTDQFEGVKDDDNRMSRCSFGQGQSKVPADAGIFKGNLGRKTKREKGRKVRKGEGRKGRRSERERW